MFFPAPFIRNQKIVPIAKAHFERFERNLTPAFAREKSKPKPGLLKTRVFKATVKKREF